MPIGFWVIEGAH